MYTYTHIIHIYLESPGTAASKEFNRTTFSERTELFLRRHVGSVARTTYLQDLSRPLQKCLLRTCRSLCGGPLAENESGRERERDRKKKKRDIEREAAGAKNDKQTMRKQQKHQTVSCVILGSSLGAPSEFFKSFWGILGCSWAVLEGSLDVLGAL